jgi:hypothetical protein
VTITLANISPFVFFWYDAWTEKVNLYQCLKLMEQRALKNVNNFMNTNIYSYLETSGGQSSNPYLDVAHFLNTRAD